MHKLTYWLANLYMCSVTVKISLFKYFVALLPIFSVAVEKAACRDLKWLLNSCYEAVAESSKKLQ